MSFREHIEKWSSCIRCHLYRERLNICLYRGEEPPVDVLFIGEAPGPKEDELGAPFVGPSGELLEEMIQEAELKLSYGFTNVVACFPNRQGRIRRPTKEEVSTCWPRLEEIITLCDPWDIVFVGKVAAQETRPIISSMFSQVRLHEIIHPAALLRRGRKGVTYGEAIRTLEGVRHGVQD